MTDRVKIIRTVYLYLAALVSLLFMAIGTGTVVNTGLKYYIFPDAEKKSYYECNEPPPVAPVISRDGVTKDQKEQIEDMLRDYKDWKENRSGERCIKPARQNKIIDAITMIIIAFPLFVVHWRIIKKEKGGKE